MAITSVDLELWSECGSGGERIRVTGERRLPHLARAKLLAINQVTVLTPLVTYREDCLVRYKVSA